MFSHLSYLLLLIALIFNPNLALAQESITSPNQEQQSSPSASPIVTPAPAAIEPVNLTVSPISVNLVTDPGQLATTSIKIRNNSESPEFLTLRLATFTANASGDAPIIRDFENNDPTKEWLSFSEESFRVSAGEWKTIQLSFSPPESAALGYYYAVLVERQTETIAAEGASVISGVPAILVLTEVRSPLAKKQLELVSFTATKRLYEYLPAEFKVVIKNTGNIQTLPIGDIFIDGQRTNDISIMQLNPAKGMILPGTQRTYTVNWNEGFPKFVSERNELGEEETKLEWDFSQADTFRIGKFTATTLFVYDDGERDIPTESSVSFWVIPWRLIGIILLILLLDLFRSKIFTLIKKAIASLTSGTKK